MDEVLHPGEVGVALGREAVLPAHVVVLAEPVGELAAVLPLGTGEAREEVLVDAAEEIDGAVGLLALAGGGELDSGDDVDELAEPLLVEAGAGVVLGEDALEAWVV